MGEVVSFIVNEKFDCEGLRYYFAPKLLLLLLRRLVLDPRLLILEFICVAAILLAIFALVGGGLGRFLVSAHAGIWRLAVISAKRRWQCGHGIRLSLSFGMFSDILIAIS